MQSENEPVSPFFTLYPQTRGNKKKVVIYHFDEKKEQVTYGAVIYTCERKNNTDFPKKVLRQQAYDRYINEPIVITLTENELEIFTDRSENRTRKIKRFFLCQLQKHGVSAESKIIKGKESISSILPEKYFQIFLLMILYLLLKTFETIPEFNLLCSFLCLFAAWLTHRILIFWE